MGVKNVLEQELTRNREKETINRAREFRREMTWSEKRLWYGSLRGHKLGFHFRREHPIGPYFIDFYALGPRVAVELDGSSHIGREDCDAIRDQHLLESGIFTIRIAVGELEDDLADKLAKIQRTCFERLGGFQYEPEMFYFDCEQPLRIIGNRVKLALEGER